MNHRVLVVDDSITIRKVVQAILSRNGYDCTASGDGQEALNFLEHEKADLILLDFVMPRMNGYQFCRELRAKEQLRNLPVVLMSAKAERIRDQFLRQTGALDAITKPFDPRALIAVVEGALQRTAEGRAPQAPDAKDMPDEEILATSDSVPPSSIFPVDAHVRATVAHTLANALAPELETSYPHVSFEQDTLCRILEYALADHDVMEAIRRLRWGTTDSEEVLCGNIASIPIGEVMQLLQMQRQNGILELTNKRMTVFIHLRDGLVDLAQCRQGDPELLLGRYFLERGILSPEDLERALKDASARNELLGTRLVALGFIQQDQLTSALARQTSEIIYETLRWQRGWFLLRRNIRSPEAESAALGLPVASIVMEGFRRVDEWRLIEETIQFEEVLIRDQVAIGALDNNQLTTQEHAVLQEIDGTRTVRQIIEQSHQSSFDICKTFYRLLKSRLVRRKAA